MPGLKPALKELVDLGLAEVATVTYSWHGGWDASQANREAGVQTLIPRPTCTEMFAVYLTLQGVDAATVA